MKPLKNVAIITSGGDAPGINSAIYGMIHEQDINFYAFDNGYDGILENEPRLLNSIELNCWTVKGEQIIKSSRSQYVRTEDGRRKIIERLKELEIDALIVCGGDGSAKAAELLEREGFPCLVIPMTIDNDIYGTDYTIGHDTAITTIKNVLNNLHQTGHNLPGRIFMVEVFGGNSGHLTLASGMAGGADFVILPEYKRDISDLVLKIKNAFSKGKEYVIIVCSEAAYVDKKYQSGDQGASFEIGQLITEELGIRVRHSVLGYSQRAGDPSGYDCLIGMQMGAFAIENLKLGRHGYLVGMDKGKCILTNLQDVTSRKKRLNDKLVKIAKSKKMLIGEEM